MQSAIQKWGNSLAIRIPRAFAVDLGLEQDSEVDLYIDDGALVLRPKPNCPYQLDEFLAQVTEENRHEEQDLGAPFGTEVW